MTRSLWAPVAPLKQELPGPQLPYGVDMSNFQGDLTPDKINALKAQNCSFVVVQAITGSDGKTYTRQQLKAALDAGLEIQGYVWCFPGESAASVTTRLHMFDGFPITRLWLDIEQAGVTVADANLALSLCDAYFGGKVGVYTAKWFFDQQGWTWQPLWADRLLWDAFYDGDPDLDANFESYGGWTCREVKQYWSKSMDVNTRRI